jgi:hypothetical protein
MDEKELERIERYLLNDLTEQEKAAFEEKMQTDAAFRHEVELHSRAIHAAKIKGREMMKERLRQRKPKVGRSYPPRNWVAVLLLSLFAILAIIWWQTSKSDEPKTLPENGSIPTPADTANSSKALPIDSIQHQQNQSKEDDEAEKKDARPPVAEKKQGTEKLFAQYFQPYRDESLDPSFRGAEDEATTFDRFQHAYWEGKHEAALAAFEELAPTLKKNDNLLFQKANSLLAVGDARAASAILEEINANGRSRYKAEAIWYLALAYLKMGEQGKAGTFLKQLATDEKNSRQSDAKKLLEQLE